MSVNITAASCRSSRWLTAAPFGTLFERKELPIWCRSEEAVF
jgi:hypothetical protein